MFIGDPYKRERKKEEKNDKDLRSCMLSLSKCLFLLIYEFFY